MIQEILNEINGIQEKSGFENKKYKAIPEGKFFRIYAVKDIDAFFKVSAGDRGGLIESEKNLSTTDDSWIADGASALKNSRVEGNAMIFPGSEVTDRALISDRARVSHNSKVYGNAKILKMSVLDENSQVFGNAVVENGVVAGNAKVYGHAKIGSRGRVEGSAEIFDNAYIHENAIVGGNAKVGGKTEIKGKAKITSGEYLDSDVIKSTPRKLKIGGSTKNGPYEKRYDEMAEMWDDNEAILWYDDGTIYKVDDEKIWKKFKRGDKTILAQPTEPVDNDYEPVGKPEKIDILQYGLHR